MDNSVTFLKYIRDSYIEISPNMKVHLIDNIGRMEFTTIKEMRKYGLFIEVDDFFIDTDITGEFYLVIYLK